MIVHHGRRDESGQLEPAVPIIGHLYKKEVVVRDREDKSKKTRRIQRQLLVGDSERYMTKERYGVLDPIIRSPDLGKILDILENQEAA